MALRKCVLGPVPYSGLAKLIGISCAQTGPAFLDLQLITSTNTQEASVFLTGSAIGSMAGCLAMGLLCSRFSSTLVMSSSLLLAAVSVAALPWCSPYILMIFMHGLTGMVYAMLSAGGNSDLMRTWEAERRVFLQILHFCFAAGSTLGPMLTEPFLAPRTIHNVTCNSSSPTSVVIEHMPVTNANAPNVNNSFVEDNHGCSPSTSETRVQFAYLITGILFLVGCIGFITQHCFKHEENKERPTTEALPNDDPAPVKQLPLPFYVTTLALILVFLFFLIGVELSVSAFLVTFVVKQLRWTKETGSELTSMFWGCYAAWRFATIFFTDYISPFTLLLTSSCVLLLSTLGILLSSVHHAPAAVWVCVGVCGLSLSSQYPSMMMWAEESILRLTPVIVSLMVMACTLPGMVVPLLIGYQMQNASPLWLIYIVVVMCGVCLFMLISLYIWTKCVLQPKITQTTAVDVDGYVCSEIGGTI